MNDCLRATLDLVHAAQAGDGDSLDRLLHRYQGRILRVVRLRMGDKLRRRYESRDLLQETLMAAFRSFDRFEVRSDAAFMNWVSRIAENRILALQQREGYEKRDAGREQSLDRSAPDRSQALGDELTHQTRSPADKAGDGEDEAKTREALQRLPAQYRELIVLRNYLEMSWQEIAEHAGRPSAAAARVMHTKAMEALAKVMAAWKDR